jgi:hypothetical protein
MERRRELDNGAGVQKGYVHPEVYQSQATRAPPTCLRRWLQPRPARA